MEFSGFTVWITGVAGAGKSSIAHELAGYLRNRGHRVEVLEGGRVREKIGKDLGYSKADYDEQVRRIGYLAGMLSRNGVAVICAATAPGADSRSEVRKRLGRFVEVHADAPADLTRQRFTQKFREDHGMKPEYDPMLVPYEKPKDPDVVCRTDRDSIHACAMNIMDKLQDLGYITRLRPLRAQTPADDNELIRQRLKGLGYL
jgi:adenylylsulfate kinase